MFRMRAPALPVRLFGLMKIIALGDFFPATNTAYTVPRDLAWNNDGDFDGAVRSIEAPS